MTTAHLTRTLLAVLLLAACSSSEAKKPGLPPAKSGETAGAPAIPGPPPPANTAATPASAATTAVASASGRYIATALPKHSAELGPKMSGTLSAVFVDEGERVKKGQTLFRLDTRSIQLGVAQADTALAGAKIARDNAERELERQRQLAEKGTISAAVLERAESAFTASTNGVSQAEVGLAMAKRGSTDSAVVSPIDGVVARKLKSVGETVTMMPPTVVVVIQDQSTLELRARIPETSLKHIREGASITAHFSALEVTRPAKIVRIQPTVDPTTRTIEIVADVDNADATLRPGMYVEVELDAPAPAASTPPAEPAAPAKTAAKSAKAPAKKDAP